MRIATLFVLFVVTLGIGSAVGLADAAECTGDGQ